MGRRISATEAGDAAGTIAAWVAKTLHAQYPHLDLDGLVSAFTTSASIEAISIWYASGLACGLTPALAAQDAGVWLINAWADARCCAASDVYSTGSHLDIPYEVTRARDERDAEILVVHEIDFGEPVCRIGVVRPGSDVPSGIPDAVLQLRDPTYSQAPDGFLRCHGDVTEAVHFLIERMYGY